MPTKSVSVRFPEALHGQVQTTADQDRRSFNSQVLHLIEQALKTRIVR